MKTKLERKDVRKYMYVGKFKKAADFWQKTILTKV